MRLQNKNKRKDVVTSKKKMEHRKSTTFIRKSRALSLEILCKIIDLQEDTSF